ncbi:MAG TPA: hypothetical protein VK835_11060 [Bacteroidia bacterium]|jgi:hypothetical protein|nr:hypothetical protein [Bacteroidia bacterium]
MYNINSCDIELEGLLDQDKVSTLANFETSHQKQEKTIEEIVNGVKHAEASGFKDTKTLWNIAGYLNITSYDLQIIARDLMFSRNEWQKRVYARQACLIIHESSKNLLVLFGKDFIELTRNRLDISEFQNNLNNIKKDLKKFTDTYYEDLVKIRNVATAHRENDVLKQIEIIHQINWSVSLSIISKFNNIINNLSRALIDIINKGFIELPELKTPNK